MKYAKTFFAFILTIALGVSIDAKPLKTVNPERQGFSAERLHRIDAVMQDQIDNQNAAGIVTLVARRGKVVYLKAFGMRDLENQKPMIEDTICRIYSMSKPITSAAMLTLYEEGKFRLTDPVSKYIPEFENLQVFKSGTDDDYATEKTTSPITILQLFTHTSGLGYGLDENSVVDRLFKKADLLFSIREPFPAKIPRLCELPLKFHPGERWEYSFSVDVMGHLVEVISGTPFERYLNERIFEPLGMNDTGFIVPPEKKDRFSKLFRPKEGGGLESFTRYRTYAGDTVFFSGGGGLASTAPDYFRFAQMLANKGELDGVRILGRKTVELMTSDRLTAEQHENTNRPGWGFGLGVGIELDTAGKDFVSVGEYGWGGTAGTKFWVDPQEDIVGVYMVQAIPPEGSISTLFKNLVYQALID